MPITVLTPMQTTKFMRKKILLILLVLIATASSSAQVLYIMKNNIGECENYSLPSYSGPERVYYIRSNGKQICPIKEIQGLNGEYVLVFDALPELYLNDTSGEDWGCGGPCYACGYRLEGSILCNLESAHVLFEGSCSLPGSVPYYFMTTNKVLTNPTISNDAFCESIPLKAETCFTTQKFSWYYSTDGINYTSMNKTTLYDESFTFKKTDFLSTSYTGNIHFKVLIDTDVTVVGEEVYSNIITYKVISCSPLLEHNPPLVSNPSCTNTATGSIPLKFKSDIKDDEQLLLNLFINTTPPQFLDSKFVQKSSIINKEYTWTNIGAGNYIIRYQAQKTTDNTTDVNSSAVTTEAFSIVDPPLFSFSTTGTEPKCNGAKGTITITASGGTPPYYYYLNNDPKIEFTSPKIIDVDAGDNYIKVEDSKYCIDNTKNDKK
ncbi:SprB repeat-containing protein [Flavobacterium succinicans]|uniref:SprB repeat-containing protein n=1 Tax=Flavobacterium succinicans TaxID=29536 RepID=A0A199XTW7_9FLAO|nr:SprB repeat-containing protein [Flavobacterium succinicans]OAZ05203.1 hypothetical protein FLB_03990 [Flavobacterium succinicans]